MLSEAFASVLRSGRAEFNAQFAHARRQYPELTGEAFSDFLSRCADPLVRAVNASDPESVPAVVMEAYEIALALVGQRFAGPGARQGAVNEGWRILLPACARLVSSEPHRLLVAISNALHTLASTPGARPAEWIAEMVRLGPGAQTPDVLLELGKVLAWRAGVAHFRNGAIEAAGRLPPELALAAVGAPSSFQWSDVRAQLETDPWFVPGASRDNLPVWRVGSFRGFGGLFSEVPQVAAIGDDLFVRSGSVCWLLVADAFGATFHRATLEEWNGAVARRASLPRGVNTRGELVSITETSKTIAFTGTLTYAVTLVPRRVSS